MLSAGAVPAAATECTWSGPNAAVDRARCTRSPGPSAESRVVWRSKAARPARRGTRPTSRRDRGSRARDRASIRGSRRRTAPRAGSARTSGRRGSRTRRSGASAAARRRGSRQPWRRRSGRAAASGAHRRCGGVRSEQGAGHRRLREGLRPGSERRRPGGQPPPLPPRRRTGPRGGGSACGEEISGGRTARVVRVPRGHARGAVVDRHGGPGSLRERRRSGHGMNLTQILTLSIRFRGFRESQACRW
jgi:hypothetical protein